MGGSATYDLLVRAAPFLLGVATLVVALLAAGHAVLYKREVRAAIAWVAVISSLPLLGALLYWILGINRIRRRARVLKGLPPREEPPPLEPRPRTHEDTLGALTHFLDQTIPRPLVGGNEVTPLEEGDAAFPAMLDALEGARSTVGLCTYLFDHDAVGELFRHALGKAHGRGVEVKVLVDAAGGRYSWPEMVPTLRRDGLDAYPFLPPRLPWRMAYLNLRNHRKLLLVDGQLAFTGGMNLREGHRMMSAPLRPIRDLHFRIRGPVVRQLQEVFCEDWAFTTGEDLQGEGWFPELLPVGSILCRALADGPDADLGRLRWALLGAIACARERIRLVTPYFLPSAELVAALTTAARRGVAVEIVLPSRSNLALVQWASTALLWQVLEGGCRVWLSAPPFDHSKILTVDRVWSLVGSANWDPRSFRLNFELDVECQDEALASRLDAIVDAKQRRSREISLEEVDSRALPVRLRDGVARLFAPFL